MPPEREDAEAPPRPVPAVGPDSPEDAWSALPAAPPAEILVDLPWTSPTGGGAEPDAVSSPAGPSPAGTASPPADQGAVGGAEAAPRGADTPAAGAVPADLPAAWNAAAAAGAGQDGPGSAPSRRDAAEEEGSDAAADSSADGSAGIGPLRDAPGGGGLSPALAALVAALDAESRSADAWLDAFLAGRVAAESAFDLARGPLGAAAGHDWPFH